jgi:hypothetical protein
MMKVYRIEHRVNGRGPMAGNQITSIDFKDHTSPFYSQVYREFVVRKGSSWKGLSDSKYRFGVVNQKSLMMVATTPNLRKLLELGYRFVELTLNKDCEYIVLEDGQVMYDSTAVQEKVEICEKEILK